MVDLECEVAIVVPGVFTGGIIIEDPRGSGERNKTEDILGNPADATCRNDVSGKGVACEATGSVGPGRGRIVELDEAPVRVP